MTETFRCEYVRCGKANCRTCPHGPYWYAYTHRKGKVKKRYVGRKHSPFEEPLQETPNPDDAIFNSKEATVSLALKILECDAPPTHAKCRHAYNIKILSNHPDRGGDEKQAARINAAWSFLAAKHPEWRK